MPVGTPTQLRQHTFRFRNDDGSETTATWKAAADTNITQDWGVIFRLRIGVEIMTGGDAQTLMDARLQFSKNGAAYANVGTAGSGAAVEFADSANVTDDGTTTQQITSGGTFGAGRIDENGTTTQYAPAGLTVGNDTEGEFVLKINSTGNSDGDTFDFRITRGATNILLTQYTQTPRATANNPVPIVDSISPNTGSNGGGQSVTISGSNFTGATSATLGGTAITSFSVVNSTTITGVTAAHAAGVVNVVVNSPSGSGTLTNGYTYVAVSGTLGATEGPDVVAFSGSVRWEMILNATEAPDVVAFNVALELFATLDATEGSDVAEFTGILAYEGTLDATEGDDVAAFVGELSYTGTLDATEESDTVAIFGGPVIEGILDATEGEDTAAFAGLVEWLAILDATEESDSSAFAGDVAWTAVLAATEESDIVLFEGHEEGVAEFESIIGKRAVADIVGKRNVADIVGRRNVADIIGRELTQ
jgi:IPT/TIG domain-containing protein